MNSIITISRQYGSMGDDIAKIIANHYMLPIYFNSDIEKEINGSIDKTVLNTNNDPQNSLLYSLAMDLNSSNYIDNPLNNIPDDHKEFIIKCNKIQELASKGSCIFVGNASDYALSDFKNVINMYFHSELETRISRISKQFNLSKIEAKKEIIKQDKQRTKFYNYFTNKKWGDPISYDFCINTSNMDSNTCANIVISLVDVINSNN